MNDIIEIDTIEENDVTDLSDPSDSMTISENSSMNENETFISRMSMTTSPPVFLRTLKYSIIGVD